MNGDSKKIYEAITDLKGDVGVLNNDIKWIIEKNNHHEEKLDCLMQKFTKGEGKISRNYSFIRAIFAALGVISTVLMYILFK